MEKYHGNTVEYWKQNAEENYLTTPISVLKYITVLEKQAEQLRKHAVKAGTPTIYLMDIDNEAMVVIARNISEAMDKAEKIAKKDYKMVYSKSLPLLY
jgi:vesicle coat complex subunit